MGRIPPAAAPGLLQARTSWRGKGGAQKSTARLTQTIELSGSMHEDVGGGDRFALAVLRRG